MHARTHTYTQMLTRAQSVYASTGVHTQKFTHASTRAKIARVRVRVRVRAATQMLAHARVRAHVCAHTRPLTHVCTVTVHAGLCESTDLPTPLNIVAYTCMDANAHLRTQVHAILCIRTLRRGLCTCTGAPSRTLALTHITYYAHTK